MLGVCTLYPQLCEGVDVRRLVQFALLNRLIRRVHCYPIVPQLSRGATPPQPSPGGDEWPPGPSLGGPEEKRAEDDEWPPRPSLGGPSAGWLRLCGGT